VRVIKFRAWDKDRNEWFIHGSLQIGLDGNLCLDEVAKNYRKNRFDILQFTGITDKNGKEIYDGDIIKDIDGSILTVQYGGPYEYCGFGVSRKRRPGEFGTDPTWDELNSRWCKDIEVIGNIYENPELVQHAN